MARHTFGGSWTDQKIELLRRYLDAYTTALKNQRFKLMYVDAFAGTGSRTVSSDDPAMQLLPGFPPLDELAKGSARVALEVQDRPFDEFVFIEKRRSHFDELSKLRDDYPDRAEKIRLLHGDANVEIIKLCTNTDWGTTRAVMFLDPYGMQVHWKTIEAIATTKCIDLWYLFPVGMGVVRMTPRSGSVPAAWRDRLDLVLGDNEWMNVFYRSTEQDDLFEPERSDVEKLTNVETVEGDLLNRLRKIFAGVAPRSWRLTSRRGQCLYLLAFAVGNERGKNIALKIARHLIDDIGNL